MKKFLAVLLVSGTALASAPQTTEVLVTTAAAVKMPQLTGRRAIEIQNNGPNAITCFLGGSTSADGGTNGRKIAASGGTWALDALAITDIYCQAASADQVAGAATIITELR